MPIRVAVVGCGNFAKFIHLPNLQKLSEYEVRMVIDADPARARDAASQFGIPNHGDDYDSALADPEIDLVVICTPHDQHAEMAIRAVNAGKHVLVEKPMTLTVDEIRPVVEAVRRSGVVFTVGLNRRYSDLSRRAKKRLDGRKYPLVISYRMVNNIVRHPWALDPKIGGGRIISEAVHLFDFLYFIVGAEPIRVYAEGGNFDHPEIPGTQDNAVITVRFSDDSIASLVIGDLGSAEYPKERVEVFSDERTLVIDDFVRLETRGFAEDVDIALPAVDKGFVQELLELGRAIRSGSPAPVTEIDGARATLCAVRAVESIRTGRAQNVVLKTYT